jgi:hypothetical protein
MNVSYLHCSKFITYIRILLDYSLVGPLFVCNEGLGTTPSDCSHIRLIEVPCWEGGRRLPTMERLYNVFLTCLRVLANFCPSLCKLKLKGSISLCYARKIGSCRIRSSISLKCATLSPTYLAVVSALFTIPWCSQHLSNSSLSIP